MFLGGLCERFRQSPLLGYLLAGALLGPNAFALLPSHEAVIAIAELGIALLLFTIGLEFSWRRLRDIGVDEPQLPALVVGVDCGYRRTRILRG